MFHKLNLQQCKNSIASHWSENIPFNAGKSLLEGFKKNGFSWGNLHISLSTHAWNHSEVMNTTVRKKPFSN